MGVVMRRGGKSPSVLPVVSQEERRSVVMVIMGKVTILFDARVRARGLRPWT